MSGLQDPVHLAIAEKAAQWFVANRDPAHDEQQAREFVEWLKASPRHVEAYLVIANVGRDLSAALAHPSINLDQLLVAPENDALDKVVQLNFVPPHGQLPARQPRHRSQGFRWAAGLVGTAIVCALITTWWVRDGERLGLSKSYRTQHGEQRTWPLPDGSVVQLNSESSITVRYSSGERVVDVDRGQALFQVAHESGRRFRVVAGTTEIVAVGTQFDVYRRPRETRVTVVEGKVAVFSGAAPAPDAGSSLPPNALHVTAGQQVLVPASNRPTLPTSVNLHSTEAWARRQIVFDHRALGEVVEEFNRYGRIPIQIEDSSLRQVPVSGVLNAYDTDSFIGFLRTLDGMAVEVSATRVRVLPVARGKTGLVTAER